MRNLNCKIAVTTWAGLNMIKGKYSIIYFSIPTHVGKKKNKSMFMINTKPSTKCVKCIARESWVQVLGNVPDY